MAIKRKSNKTEKNLSNIKQDGKKQNRHRPIHTSDYLIFYKIFDFDFFIYLYNLYFF